jgi:hypothetical protein
MVIWNFRIKLLVCQSVSVSTLLNQQVRWNFLKISMKKLCELVVLSINHILSLWYMYLWWFACCNSYFTSHDELSFHKSYQVVMYGLFNMEMYSKAIFNVHRNTGDKILGGWSLFTQCHVTPTPAPVAQFFSSQRWTKDCPTLPYLEEIGGLQLPPLRLIHLWSLIIGKHATPCKFATPTLMGNPGPDAQQHSPSPGNVGVHFSVGVVTGRI